jgi:hypothetical protein
VTTKHRTAPLDFALIGAQKSGTTALHYFLKKHPQVTMGDQQEIHFFDEERNFASRPPDYAALHAHYPNDDGLIAGDCTPSYLFWPPAAERLCQYQSSLKLLVLLRNPIDRAFAHWNMQRFKKREPFDFLPALREEGTRTADPLSVDARRFSYVGRGYYSRQLRRFFQLFPREQFLILKSEDFRERPLEIVNIVFQFLNLPPVRSVRSKDRNVVPYEREMSKEERRELAGIFAGEIEQLEQLLGWDCSDWKP